MGVQLELPAITCFTGGTGGTVSDVEYVREMLARLTLAIENGATLEMRASSIAGHVIAELESATGARYCVAEATTIYEALTRVLQEWNDGTLTRRKPPK